MSSRKKGPAKRTVHFKQLGIGLFALAVLAGAGYSQARHSTRDVAVATPSANSITIMAFGDEPQASPSPSSTEKSDGGSGRGDSHTASPSATATSTATATPTLAPTAAPAPELKTGEVPKANDCLKKLFGGDRSSQILSGKPMTASEVTQATGVCFNVSITKQTSTVAPSTTRSPRATETPEPTSGKTEDTQKFSQVSVIPAGITTRPAAYDCVVAKLGADAAKSIFDQGKQPSGGLGAAKDCFGEGKSELRQQPSASVIACLKDKGITQDVIDAISNGTKSATSDQLDTAKGCYQTEQATPFVQSPKQVTDDSPAMLCAKAILNVTDLSALKTSGLTATQRAQVASCFTPSQPALAPAAKPSLSTTVEACLKAALGDTFAQIQSGQVVPTDAQKQAGKACFQKESDSASASAKTVAAVVPKDQAEALLTATEDQKVLPRPSVVAAKDSSKNVTISGEIAADVSTADVYVNSDTQIITVPVVNGAWTASVPASALDAGVQHTMYAVASTDTGLVRSQVVAFNVTDSTVATPAITTAPAATDSAALGAVTSGTPTSPLPYIAGIITALGVAWFVIRAFARR